MNFWISLIYIGIIFNLANGRESKVKIKTLNYPICSSVPARQVTGIKTIKFGLNVTRGYYPWHAAIFKFDVFKSEYTCGGTLISSATVLTAAHCLHENSELIATGMVLVRFDVTHLNVNGKDHLVYLMKVHEHFNDDNLQHDIALLKLRTKVTFTDFIRPVCLTNKKFNIFDVFGYVAGFGQTARLMDANMPGKSFKDCKLNNPKFYRDYVNPDYNFCAGNTNGTTISKGDSGGAMIFEFSNVFYARGIISLAPASRRGIIDPQKYLLFTDIQSHYEWIVDQLDVSEINESEENEIFLTSPHYSECTDWRNIQVTEEPTLTYGRKVPRGYYPWHTTIFRINEIIRTHICDGILINSESVLTAAHCMYEKHNLLPAVRVFVKVDATKWHMGTRHLVRAIACHENFNLDNLQHDIAVLKLKTKVTFSDFIRPACLANENFNIEGIFGYLVGFGESSELNDVSMPGRSFVDCETNNPKFYNNYVNPDYNFCAGNVNGTKLSRGYGGGGLVFNKSNILYVRGILSLVQTDERRTIDSTKYSLFTDIQSHYKWIVEQMEASEDIN